ncbi:MAG: heme-binding protein [Deltaproteobacteria bacterium]|nr:heme-binding protein [Deltaproteobacteria bacterium]
MRTITALKLSEEGANAVLQAALEKARSFGVSVSIAVVDDGGHLMSFARMDGVELYTIAIAQAKGRGAALTRFPTGKKSPTGNERTDHHALAITLAAGTDSFVTIPGGAPIILDGHCLGAVGVSGAGEKDREIALSAARALETG